MGEKHRSGGLSKRVQDAMEKGPGPGAQPDGRYRMEFIRQTAENKRLRLADAGIILGNRPASMFPNG